jgi:Flp pilus assembly pilin Flp
MTIHAKTIARRFGKDAGQGMTEYIIIVALIAIAAIGIVTVFGSNVRVLFGGITQALSGNQNVNLGNLQSGQQQANTPKTLGDFGRNQ